MQSAAEKYIKAIFVLKLTFSRGGVVGIRKCILQVTTDKKDPEPTEYFIQINADYSNTCGYYRTITPERTLFRQSRRKNTP